VGGSQIVWGSRTDLSDGQGISCRPLLDVAGDVADLVKIGRAVELIARLV
jgi:hypothetical protein